MVMKDELVELEVAKLAKEKRFDEICLDSFDFNGISTNRYNIDVNQDMSDKEIQKEFEIKNSDLVNDYTARPTQSLLQRWLRETHGIHIEIISKKYKTKVATCIPRTFKYIINGTYSLTTYNTYEYALEEGLQQGLKLI